MMIDAAAFLDPPGGERHLDGGCEIDSAPWLVGTWQLRDECLSVCLIGTLDRLNGHALVSAIVLFAWYAAMHHA